MSNQVKKKSFLEILKLIKKRIKLRTILLLAIMLSCNSFAWFVYATKVSTGVTAHVKTWNILFSSKDNQIEEEVQFSIPSIYPGMDDYTDSIVAYNNGEHTAVVNYKITEATVLGVNYRVDDNILTSDMLENILADDFPFKITMNVSNNEIEPGSGTSTFSLSVVWPYESGDDELDTYWGIKSYEYSNNNPDKDSIILKIKVSAVQPDF